MIPLQKFIIWTYTIFFKTNSYMSVTKLCQNIYVFTTTNLFSLKCRRKIKQKKFSLKESTFYKSLETNFSKEYFLNLFNRAKSIKLIDFYSDTAEKGFYDQRHVISTLKCSKKWLKRKMADLKVLHNAIIWTSHMKQQFYSLLFFLWIIYSILLLII